MWRPPSSPDDSMSSSSESDVSDQVKLDSKFKESLLDCLDDLQASGNFAARTADDAPINPGLHVDGVGLVPLPLTEHYAQQLIAVARQAPFGRGDETIVDTSVRRTWEINANAVTFSNPAWTRQYLPKLVASASTGLGIPSWAVSAQPYKLLLYGPGSFFKKHKDSEKVAGMIGTLVVCLAAEHQGGDVSLSHAGSTTIFSTAESSKFGLTALAWYSDVTHEVLELNSGYRLVLTYNLVRSNPVQDIRLSATAVTEHNRRLEKLLGTWKACHPHIPMLLYQFEHKYTPSSLSLGNLKGKDRESGQYLQGACSRLSDFCLLLANLEFSEEPEDYYDMGDGTFSAKLDNIITAEGVPIMGSLNLDVDDKIGQPFELLCLDAYKDRTADSEDEGEFTGNESTPSTYRYHDSVAMIVQSKNIADVFLKDHHPTRDQLEYVVNRVALDLASTPDPKATRVQALSSMRKVVQCALYPGFSSREYVDDVGSQILKVLLALGNHDLYKDLFKTCLNAGRQNLGPKVIHTLADYVSTKAGALENTLTMKQWDEWLGATILAVPNAPTKLRVLKALESQLSSETLQQSLRQWSAKIAEREFQVIATLDVIAMSDLVIPLLAQHEYALEYTNKFIPIISQKADRPALLAFLSHLSRLPAHTVCRDIVQDIARRIFEACLSKMTLSLTDLRGRQEIYPVTWSNRYVSSGNPHHGNPRYDEFVDLVRVALDLDLTDSLTQLLHKSRDQLIYSKNFVNQRLTALEFLSVFLEALNGYENVPKEAVKAFVENLLLSVKRSLEKRPKEPSSPLVFTPRGCGCQDCNALDQWLVTTSPNLDLQINKQRRDHISSKLSPSARQTFFHASVIATRGTHTLQIRKVPGSEYKDQLIEWKSKMADVLGRYRKLEGVYLMDLLGERYAELVLPEQELANEIEPELSRAATRTMGQPQVQARPVPAGILTPSALSASNAMAPRLGDQPASVAGIKRKADVLIVLDD